MPFQKGNTLHRLRKKVGRTPRYERYAGTFERVDMYLDAHVEEYVQVLTALALGEIKVEKIEVDREGEAHPVIYTIPPNRQALEYLIDRHLYKPSTREDAMLGEARAEATKMQVGLIAAQTAGQKAQVRYTDVQTEAFKLSTITPEIFDKVMMMVIQTPLALLQSISEEEWKRFGESMSARQEFFRRVGHKMASAQGEALEQVYAEAIPAKFEPRGEEGEGDDADGASGVTGSDAGGGGEEE